MGAVNRVDGLWYCSLCQCSRPFLNASIASGRYGVIGLHDDRFLKVRLPWSSLPACPGKSDEDVILGKKDLLSTEELCKDLPVEFRMYMDHIRSLRHGDAPRYDWLRKKFRGLFSRLDFEHDNVYDWTILKFFMEEEQREEMTSLARKVLKMRKPLDKPATKFQTPIRDQVSN